MTKAIGLISGGLDSVLSLKIIQEQNIEVIGVYILTPFMSGFGEKTIKNLKRLEKTLGFQLKIIKTDKDYLDIVKHPEFGYGKNLNPCIDCHIYMLKKAKEIMEEEKGEFVFTGEVLNQRRKSQTITPLRIIEEKSSLKNRLVRPLSALFLPPTEPEEKGILDRNKLLGLKGRERKVQLYMAGEKDLKYYDSPAGGCLLTDFQFCERLKNLLHNKKDINTNDCLLLQLGRHFHVSADTSLIISRNETEKNKMNEFLENEDFVITSPDSPELFGIIKGKLSEITMRILASYGRKESSIIEVKDFKGNIIEKKITLKEDKLQFHKFLI